jgi:hypothetical protein
VARYFRKQKTVIYYSHKLFKMTNVSLQGPRAA